ncbi:type III-A CRISPR-associated protein Csm2 [Shewanella sp. 4t3-1-2LB]|uniref:type III-A CRISPR-associated protein Csm2 n=1 Tax=Shewanella sp. 4t3-1-2LB TaxID=2817682 RepID=UPI001A989649|nr:type III-A CRISPR-associated protein Csm2 [Shewanella sp. 4t3-1-2LB]MBO1270820.1 type III-A CRISPR-associated protein Csm2 [Shewanella sp. 4t3-1-2LB]
MSNQELLSKLVFSGPKEDIELYNQTAEAVAKALIPNEGTPREYKDANKPTQLRRFFDELTLWHQRTRDCSDEQFQTILPRIKMMKAKVAYAKGRKHVDDFFYDVFKKMIDPMSSKQELDRAKLFFEAVLGFSKMHNPKK